MKKLFLAISLFVGNSIIANEPDTIIFAHFAEKNNAPSYFPIGYIVKKIDNSTYQKSITQFTSNHKYTVVEAIMENTTDTPGQPNEPALYLLVYDPTSKEYCAMPLNFSYEPQNKEKGMLGLEVVHNPAKPVADKKPETQIKKAPKKAPLPLRFTIYGLALIGGYQVISKIAQFCHKQVIKTKPVNVKS